MTKEELIDELSAIDAIYPDSTHEEAPQIHSFKVPENEDVQLQMSFPLAYPDEPPSILQVIVDNAVKYSDTKYLERQFTEKLSQVYIKGEVCMFEYLSELQMMLETYNDRDLADKVKQLEIRSGPEPEPVRTGPQDTSPKKEKLSQVDPFEGWEISEPIVDRGSTFIGFAREVRSVEEAQEYFETLLTDRKIAKAAHNMSAWRIKGTGGVQYQDCDDDGETAAGGRLLHLLTMMDVWNVMVVVSRWFGGVHLGPDRFKHINSAGRNAVLKVSDNGKNNTGKEGKKKKK